MTKQEMIDKIYKVVAEKEYETVNVCPKCKEVLILNKRDFWECHNCEYQYNEKNVEKVGTGDLIYKIQLQSKLEEYIQEHILDYTSEMEIENENFLDSDKLLEKIKDYVESFIDDFIENPKYYKEEGFYNLIK